MSKPQDLPFEVSSRLRWRLEDLQQTVADRREALDRGLGELARQEHVATDVDGCVQITVDGHGAVRAVYVDPTKIQSVSGTELGQRVVEATRAAQQASVAAMRPQLAHLPDGDVLARLAEATDIGAALRDGDTSGERR